jgi:methylmalonyl-CoA epimerase
MKAVLDHVGIAVRDLNAAIAFYRDALGLEIEPPEEVATQRVRAHFIHTGESALELLEGTAADSPISKYVEKRGPGLHHITLRVDDLREALAQLKARGATLIDEQPRPGAEGSLVAFVHPKTAHGVLVELKQARSASPAAERSDRAPVRATKFTLGDLDLVSLHDGFFRLDGGAIFGIVPQARWAAKAPPDGRNRILLAMRPLVVRGVRTMIIDPGMGGAYADDDAFNDVHAVDRSRNLDDTLAEAGLTPEDIDIVLASHLHFDHVGGGVVRDAGGRLRPRFPRARYVVRRGEWEDATQPNARSRSSYRAADLQALADAGVLEMVSEDQTIMPGVRVRRTGGHTLHHQMIWIESAGRHAAFAADLLPTTAHLPDAWMLGYDLYPVDTLAAKAAFVREAEERAALVFLVHDPHVAAARIVTEAGRRRFIPQPA